MNFSILGWAVALQPPSQLLWGMDGVELPRSDFTSFLGRPLGSSRGALACQAGCHLGTSHGQPHDVQLFDKLHRSHSSRILLPAKATRVCKLPEEGQHVLSRPKKRAKIKELLSTRSLSLCPVPLKLTFLFLPLDFPLENSKKSYLYHACTRKNTS